MSDPLELARLQQEKWGPVVKWFCERHSVSIQHTTGFGKPSLSPNCEMALTNHLKSYSILSLVGKWQFLNLTLGCCAFLSRRVVLLAEIFVKLFLWVLFVLVLV